MPDKKTVSAPAGEFSMRREILAALVTFSTMAYILCVQPALMSGAMVGTNTGMDAGALLTATCLVSAFGSILMGVWARYPFALAPGMGPNFFVVCTVIPLCAGLLGVETGASEAWQLALGVVLVSGLLFLVISLLGLRSMMINAFSSSLKGAFGLGIGLFIARLGLENAGLIKVAGGTLSAGALNSWDTAIFLLGLTVCTVLYRLRIPCSVLIGIAAAAILAAVSGRIKISGVVGLPADPSQIFFKADVAGILHHLIPLLPSILILCFMDIFDTLGTVVGIAQKSRMMVNGKLPRMERVFASDAIATVAGALGGHSTVTAYIESAAGVACGGKTGWTAVWVGIFFLLSLIFSPIILTLAGCGSITASVLVFVGFLMMESVLSIDWSDATEGIPAFLIAVGIPFTSSIATGMMFGLIPWPWLKLLTGKGKEVHWGIYVLSIILTAYALFVRI